MQTKSLNKLVLNLKTPKITQESLDDEIREMFKNRKEGLDFINSQDWESEQSKQNAMKRLDRVYPRTRRVKGSSPEYTARVNKQYEEILPLLKEKGYDVDSFTSETIDNHFDSNIRQHLDKFFKDSDADKEIQDLYTKHDYDKGNALWNERYRPTFNALMRAYDKYYNDWWQANAPMGYEEED